MKKLLLALSLLGLLTLFSPTPAQAASSEQILQFDSNILIKRDNSAVITETIRYDFGTTYRHGIYRDIPIDYYDGSDVYYINFKLHSVKDEQGKDIETELSKEAGNERIRIGDPDKTITGAHTYVISYTLHPIVAQLDGRAFLNLDVIGQGWKVPIYNITATVSLEDNAQLSDVSWYNADTGKSDSTDPTLTLASLSAYQGSTINAYLPDGYVSTYLQPNVKRLGDIIESIVIALVVIGSVLSSLAVVAILIARAVRTHRRRKSQTVVAQYEPPKDMLPAHIGFLQDDVAEGREVTATVIDWAVRGYLKIEYIPKKGLFGKKDYRLISLKEPTGLSPIELNLYNGFFDDTINEVLLSQLNKTEMSTKVTGFKSSLKSELTNKGYYDKDGHLLMRGTLSEAGAKHWALVDGFRLYLSAVEKDRMAFHDAPEKTPERFSEYLPYAIALGVEKEWAKQFKDIDLSEATTWYSGNMATFSAVALASDLGSSFASTVSSNSTVSSSGGSSGGGFGGGGGGSW